MATSTGALALCSTPSVRLVAAPRAAAAALGCQKLIPGLRDPLAFAEAARNVASRADLHGLTSAYTWTLHARALRRAGRTAPALQALRAANTAHRGLVFGPFGDDGDHYLGRVFPPELHLDERTPLRGRFGSVTPRVVAQRHDVDVHGFELPDPTTDQRGCFYLLHQPRVEQPLACYLEVGCSGSFEVFVNGKPIHRVDAYGSDWTGTAWVPVGLRRGANQVLVKTALNGFDTVSLGYVDGAGRDLRMAEVSDPSHVEPLAAEPDADAPGPFVSPLGAIDRAAREATDADAALLRVFAALVAAEARALPLALEHALAAEALQPSDVATRLGLALAIDQAERLPEELRRSRARAVLDGLGDAAKQHAWAIEQRARVLADEDKYEPAIRLLQAEIDAGRGSRAMAGRLLGFYNKLEFRAEAARLRAAWLARDPNCLPLAVAEADERLREGDVAGAKAVLLAARATVGGDDQLNMRLFNLAGETGDEPLLRTAHAERFAMDPTSPEAQRVLGEGLTRLGRRDEANQTWKALAANPRADHEQIERAGVMLLQAGDAPTGKQILQQVLRRDPSRHDVRKLLGRLAGQPTDYPAIAPFRRDAAALLAEFKPGEGEQGAAATMLLDQMIVEVFDDGSAVEEVHQLRRINDQSGVEKHQQAEGASRAAEVETLHTITADGKRYVPNRVSGAFAMPRLAPGAFVEERWRRFENAPGAEPWRSAEFHFQSLDEPFGLSELVVILPAQHQGSFRTRNFSGTPEVRKLDDGRTAHVFTRRDVPRLTEEKLAPPTDEVVPMVSYGADRTPLTRARQARDYFAYRTRGSSIVTAQATALGKDLTSDTARLRAIHAFVHKEIPSSSGASDPTAVLLRKQGDRFWLLVALLRAAELPLTLGTCAATIDAMRSEAAPLFAGEDDYGIDVVRVEPRDGAPVWLFQDDPRYLPLGQLPAERMGAPAILFVGDQLLPVRIPGGDPASADGMEIHGRATLDAQGTLSLKLEGQLRGRDGFGAADSLRQREDNVRKMAARQFAAQVLKGWTPKSIELVLTEVDQPLRLAGELTKKRALTAAGDAFLLELPLDKRTWLASLGDRAERKLPLVLHGQVAGTWEMAIDVSQTHRFAEVPQDLVIRHPLLDYSQTYRLQDGLLVVRRDYFQRPGRLAPNQFADWLDILRRIDLAEESKVRLIARP
jgi:hypothetical protein